VTDDGRCPWCNLEEESTAHAIWFCPAAKYVWNACHSIFQKCAFVEQSFLGIFQHCLNRFDRFETALFAAIAKTVSVSFCDDTWFDQIPSCIFDIVTRE